MGLLLSFSKAKAVLPFNFSFTFASDSMLAVRTFDFGDANQITIFAPLNFPFRVDEMGKRVQDQYFDLKTFSFQEKLRCSRGYVNYFFFYIWVEVLVSSTFSMDIKCSKTYLGGSDFGDDLWMLVIS